MALSSFCKAFLKFDKRCSHLISCSIGVKVRKIDENPFFYLHTTSNILTFSQQIVPLYLIMIHQYDPSDFLERTEHIPVIDVRAPGEFAAGHIPGAHSMPLFTDEERTKVGIRYKQAGREAAIMVGLDLIGPKLSWYVKQARKIAPHHEVLMHCWRGGMRSGSLAWLLDTSGFKVVTLNGGYKSYRGFIREQLRKPANILILGGMTGSGKTNILKEIQKQGEQLIDLEGLAHHKGSSFGAIGQGTQPSSEQFENDLFPFWKQINKEKILWLEDESRGIGTVNIPEPIYTQMRRSPVIKIEMPKELRIQRLVKEYTGCEKQLLRNAVSRISKRLGGLNTKRSLEAIEKGDYALVADLTLDYYDKAYNYGLSKRMDNTVFPLKLPSDGPVANASKVIEFATNIHASFSNPAIH